MNILVTLYPGIGEGLGPDFIITCDVDEGWSTTATEAELLAGIEVTAPDGTNFIYIQSVGLNVCINVLTLPVEPLPPPTTTTTSTTVCYIDAYLVGVICPTTTTTTTEDPFLCNTNFSIDDFDISESPTTTTTSSSTTTSSTTITTTTTTTQAPIEYGALYNFWAATDSREITSDADWVVPESTDLETLYEYIDDYDIGTDSWLLAGGILKDTSSDFWNTPNTGATNAVGFSMRGSGFRDGTYGYDSLKDEGYFWTATESIEYPTSAIIAPFTKGSSAISININGTNKSEAYSIRLLYTGAGTPTTYIGNDGKVYPVVLIGTQYWLAANLNETKYRNGDWITGYDGGAYTPITDVAWAALTTEAVCYYNDDINNG